MVRLRLRTSTSKATPTTTSITISATVTLTVALTVTKHRRGAAALAKHAGSVAANQRCAGANHAASPALLRDGGNAAETPSGLLVGKALGEGACLSALLHWPRSHTIWSSTFLTIRPLDILGTGLLQTRNSRPMGRNLNPPPPARPNAASNTKTRLRCLTCQQRGRGGGWLTSVLCGRR